MRKRLGEIKTLAISFFERAPVRKGMMTVVAVFFVLQFYFVRELLAAELLFGLGFAVLLVAGGLSYLIGSAGERGLELAEVGVQVIRDVDAGTIAIAKSYIGDRTSGRVFESRKGTPLVNGNVNRFVLKPLCKKIGIPVGTTHAFRHGRVSVLHQNAFPVI